MGETRWGRLLRDLNEAWSAMSSYRACVKFPPEMVEVVATVVAVAVVAVMIQMLLRPYHIASKSSLRIASLLSFKLKDPQNTNHGSKPSEDESNVY